MVVGLTIGKRGAGAVAGISEVTVKPAGVVEGGRTIVAGAVIVGKIVVGKIVVATGVVAVSTDAVLNNNNGEKLGKKGIVGARVRGEVKARGRKGRV